MGHSIAGRLPSHVFVLGTEAFRALVQRENARSVRSGRSFLLLLFDVSQGPGGKEDSGNELAALLGSCTRETDVKGWYLTGKLFGILFTEFGSMSGAVEAAQRIIMDRLSLAVSTLSPGRVTRVTPHILPSRIIVSEEPPGHIQ